MLVLCLWFWPWLWRSILGWKGVNEEDSPEGLMTGENLCPVLENNKFFSCRSKCLVFVSQHYCSIKINKWYKIRKIWVNKSVILLAKICSLLAQKALKHNFRFPDNYNSPVEWKSYKFNLRKSWLENDLKFQCKPNQHFLRGWFTLTFFHMIIWCRSNG